MVSPDDQDSYHYTSNRRDFERGFVDFADSISDCHGLGARRVTMPTLLDQEFGLGREAAAGKGSTYRRVAWQR